MQRKSLQCKISDGVRLNVFFQEFDDGTVTADCVEIPGCSIEGRNEEDAKVKIKAAIEGCLEALLKDYPTEAPRARVSAAF